MINFIPVEYYSTIFFYFMLLLVLLVWIKVNKSHKLIDSSPLAILLVWGLIFYMGLRPIHGVFVDMTTYAMAFERFTQGIYINMDRDIGFQYFMLACSKLMTINIFFLTCAFIYIYSHYKASINIFGNKWYYAFIILISTLTFWGAGSNGIRNGLAAAILLLALSYESNKIITVLLLLIAVSFHKTMLLPLGAYILTFIHNKPKTYLAFWLLCIPLSLALGGVFEVFFGSIGFDDDRLSYLTEGNVNDDAFSSTGFRWDFLLYGATAVFSGWYFIIKKKFEDTFYYRLFNVYLIANGFWILVIRANFSNRFAYLSWFMMGLVIIYPFLKGNFMPNQPKKMGLVILIYFMFTFLMNVLLA
jgi:hypothetical protein